MNDLTVYEARQSITSWCLVCSAEDHERGLGRASVAYWLSRAAFWAHKEHDSRERKILVLLDFVQGRPVSKEDLEWVRKGIVSLE